MKKLITAIVLATVSICSSAEDMRFGMNLGTFHFNKPTYNKIEKPHRVYIFNENGSISYWAHGSIETRTVQFNDVNPGLYVVKDGWSVGFYENSHWKTSYHIDYTFYKVGGSPIDVTLGAVTGYPLYPVVPMMVPSIKVGFLRIGLIVPVYKDMAGGVTFMLEQ